MLFKPCDFSFRGFQELFGVNAVVPNSSWLFACRRIRDSGINPSFLTTDSRMQIDEDWQSTGLAFGGAIHLLSPAVRAKGMRHDLSSSNSNTLPSFAIILLGLLRERLEWLFAAGLSDRSIPRIELSVDAVWYLSAAGWCSSSAAGHGLGHAVGSRCATDL
jgi:hypothetical protein